MFGMVNTMMEAETLAHYMRCGEEKWSKKRRK